jgi:alpha-2-macroglobulin
LTPGFNHLRVTQDVTGTLYYNLVQQVYLPQAEIPAAGVVPVTRVYKDMDGRVITEAQQGQLVQVELSYTLQDLAYYLILEDHLPGGLEALNENLNTSSHDSTLTNLDGAPFEAFYWQDYGYNNKEIRADRVAFFISQAETGTRTLTYLARVTQSGTFTALPAEFSAMYDPTLWGHSSSDSLTVSPNLEILR